jgi:hypothetical protein
MQCIFCHKESTSSQSIEHIIPESLGNKHHYLPQGYVCDQCNNYFSIKIEKELLKQPYFVSMRFRNDILSKKGRPVKEKMFFPSALKSSEVSMQKSGNRIVITIEDEDVWKSIIDGKTRTMYELYIPEPEYPNVIMSRFLAKCAYEYFLYNMGEDKYDLCVQELLGSEKDILNNLREYARYGKGKTWQYHQRRLYSEGDCYFNQNENICYEILHEMKLFVKEHKHFQNGNVEAEIYFVMAIAGIEYAICLSDPDISEYLKWIEEHKGLSPLEDDAETLSFSLSDVNPMLIKKDDDRIH